MDSVRNWLALVALMSVPPGNTSSVFRLLTF